MVIVQTDLCKLAPWFRTGAFYLSNILLPRCPCWVIQRENTLDLTSMVWYAFFHTVMLIIIIIILFWHCFDRCYYYCLEKQIWCTVSIKKLQGYGDYFRLANKFVGLAGNSSISRFHESQSRRVVVQPGETVSRQPAFRRLVDGKMLSCCCCEFVYFEAICVPLKFSR